jgi:hypothetical protein
MTGAAVRPPDKGGVSEANGGLVFRKANPPLAKGARSPLVRGAG